MTGARFDLTADRRLRPANARVVAADWPGDAPQELRRVLPEVMTVRVPLSDLRAAPEGARDRQLIFGEEFEVLERRDGWAFGRAARDGYVGYMASDDLGAARPTTHLVTARTSHIYPAPDIKSEERAALSHGARLSVVSVRAGFVELADGGFVPHQHVAGISIGDDPVAEAECYLGAPYLWGGNSMFGIDCSGLVQAAFLACGQACPGDADLQQAALGHVIGDNMAPRRGDLMFWRGHVALVVDGERLIHANAHAMAVAHEPIAAAIARIEAQGEGPVLARKRVPGLGS